jgi:glutaredoxin
MVIIYGNELCGYCRKAKKLAEQYHLKYEWRDTDNLKTHNELKTMLPNSKTIPQIWWHGKHIGGYEDFAKEVEDTIGNYGQETF